MLGEGVKTQEEILSFLSLPRVWAERILGDPETAGAGATWWQLKREVFPEDFSFLLQAKFFPNDSSIQFNLQNIQIQEDWILFYLPASLTASHAWGGSLQSGASSH